MCPPVKLSRQRSGPAAQAVRGARCRLVLAYICPLVCIRISFARCALSALLCTVAAAGVAIALLPSLHPSPDTCCPMLPTQPLNTEPGPFAGMVRVYLMEHALCHPQLMHRMEELGGAPILNDNLVGGNCAIAPGEAGHDSGLALVSRSGKVRQGTARYGTRSCSTVCIVVTASSCGTVHCSSHLGQRCAQPSSSLPCPCQPRRLHNDETQQPTFKYRAAPGPHTTSIS